jgi:hypothetical protein
LISGNTALTVFRWIPVYSHAFRWPCSRLLQSFTMNPGSLSCIQMAVFAITAEFYNESRFTLMHSDGRVRDCCRVLQWIPVYSHAFRWPCSRLLQSFTMNPGLLSCIQMTVTEIIAHEATVVFNTMNDLMMEVLWFKVEPRNIRTNLRFFDGKMVSELF